jgi:hypothetical protein
MRTLTIEHDGEEHELAATFGASVELADRVGDPMFIAREAALEATMMQARIPYQPKFVFTVQNVPEILAIGLKAAGSKLKKREIEEMVFDAGFLHARKWAADYLALIVEPKPTVPLDEPEDEYDEDEAGNGESSKDGAAA